MSYNADQDSFDYEEYEIEDEMCETRSIDEHKGDVSYGVEDKFLDNTDESAYADEPLADDSWVEEYLQRRIHPGNRRIKALIKRRNPLIFW